MAKLKPVPFSKFYNKDNGHVPIALEESEVSQLIEVTQSIFTKVDTVFENDEITVVRILEPLIRFDIGYSKPGFLARELFIATYHMGEKREYIAIASPLRFNVDEAIPDKDVRTALVRFMKDHWNVSLK